jgi:acetylornithine/succinyldiaminopimelate/putrescine aminotransferase
MATTKRSKSYVARQSDSTLEVVRSSGNYLYDPRGKRYIDFVMGWCVGNFGWAQPEIQKELARFKGPDYVYPDYAYKPWNELGKLLVEIAPGNLAKCFRATGGSEAVELAIQAAMLHTGRRGFLSLEDSYHGNTFGAMSVAASDYRDTFRGLLPNCHRIEPPLDNDALDKIETRLKRRDIAAFIMEPISINLGVCIPEPGFMTGLRNLCNRYGTLLILDEVACGFGRTGKLFAAEHFGVSPDIMCVAKAFSGGRAALGAMIATPSVARTMENRGEYYSSYGWHPLSTHAGLATIRYIRRHRRLLLSHVNEMSEYFRDRILAIEFNGTAKLRIIGLAVGIDVGDEKYASRIKQKCHKDGLLVVSQESTIHLNRKNSV